MADHDTHDHTGVPGVTGVTSLDALLATSSGEDIADALTGAAAPDAGNVFATMADVGGGFTTVDATLAGDVTMTTGGTFYDGPSASFVAGTWLIWYKLHFQTAGTNTHEYSCKLWNGSTIYDESEQDVPVNPTIAGYGITVNGHALVTIGTTTTIKVSATDVRNGAIMLRDLDNAGGGSHTATRMTAIKIA